MTITNQKPAVLTPVYTDNISKDFDPVSFIRETVVKPLFVPLVAGHTVTIKDQGNDLDEDQIAGIVLDAIQDNFNPIADAQAKSLYGQGLVNFDKKTNLTVNELFAVQSGTAAHLPEPNANIVYTPSQDIIPTARKFLSGICDYDTFFASLAYYARPNILGFYFVNELAFNDFKTWVSSQMAMLGQVLSQQVNALHADFQKLELKELTESLMLRNDDSENNDPGSFARLIISLLMNYTTVVSPSEYGVLPFTLSELYCPKNIVFVNVERHSKATAKQIAEEWQMINRALQQPPKMINNQRLSKLTAVQRNMAKIARNAATSASGFTAGKAAKMRFRKSEPTTVDLTRTIKKILDKMAFVNKSQNIYKMVKPTFNKPNRRDPDDFNKQGKSVSIQYKPDIHLYIDTSGSISETNYEDAVKMCIAMAKKLNINMYFNSFSSILSQTTKLHLENRSKKQIYNEFQKIDKVTGGTDYAQIWHFINLSKKRRKELSLIITDFEYHAPTAFIKHPKNLYYIPCSHMDWNNMVYWAESFAKSMLHNDPDIRKHILF